MKFNSRLLAKYVQCLSFNSQNWRGGGMEHICAVLVADKLFTAPPSLFFTIGMF